MASRAEERCSFCGHFKLGDATVTMARALISTVCRSSAIDSRTNGLSLFEIMEEIKVQATIAGPRPDPLVVPLAAQIIHFVARDNFDVPEIFNMRCRIVGPSGKTMQTSPTMAVDMKTHQRARVVMGLEGMPIEGSGRYEFVFEHEKSGDTWTEVARHPLLIALELVEQPVAA